MIIATQSGLFITNFPWPQSVTDKQKQSIEEAAQAVLDARAKYPDSSLADLYDPLTMPPDLVKAHRRLDAAVDAAYSKKNFLGDSDRVAFLFELYRQLEAPLTAMKKNKKSSNKEEKWLDINKKVSFVDCSRLAARSKPSYGT